MSEQIYQYLLDNTKFDLPMDIVARQAGNILQRQYINLLSRGLSRQQVDEQMEQLRAGSEEQAKEQLKTFFIMDKVAEKLEIEVTEEEINGHIAQRGDPAGPAAGEAQGADGARRLALPVPPGRPPEQMHQQTARIGEHYRASVRREARKGGKAQEIEEEAAAESEEGKDRGLESVKDGSMSAKDYLKHIGRPDTYDQYAQYQRYRQMSLDDMLLENRIVFLIGDINYARAAEVIMKLLYLDNLKKGREISLYINSPGGTVDDTLAIYDTMRFVGSPIATYCIGRAQSGGAVVLAAGTKGSRFALPHAKIMLHQPWGGVTGQASDIKIQAEEILRAKQTINRHPGQAHRPAAREDPARDRAG